MSHRLPARRPRPKQMHVNALLMTATLAAWAVQAQEQPPSAPPPASSPAKPAPQAEAVAPHAEPPPAGSSVSSIARVREKLTRNPPSIAAPPPKADFTIHIEERRPLQEIFDVPLWATSPLTSSALCAPRGSSSLPPPTCGSPSGFSVDPGSLVGSVRRAFSARAARDEVRRTIIEYCAAQPNGGAGIKICADEAR